MKFWDFSTKGIIYYDLNKAGLFGNSFKILQRAFKPEKITGAYLYHGWITGKVFIIFSRKDLAQYLHYSLGYSIFPEGKMVILLGLIFLLDRYTQD